MNVLLAVGAGFAVAYGLVIGSFLAVCIVRLPEDRSLLTPSACPRCGTPIRWHDNVPIVSFVALRGRCRACAGPISRLHPLVELLGGLLGLLVYRQVVTDAADLDLLHGLAWAARFGFLCLLVVAAYVDIRHRIIPDETSIYAVPFGIGLAWLLGALGWEAPGWVTWQQAVVGATLWGGLFALVSLGFRFVTGVDGLGWGDVKLAAMLGAFLGPVGGLVSLLFASLGGSIVGIAATLALRRRPALPFGPPIALGATIYVLWGPALAQLLPIRPGWG